VLSAGKRLGKARTGQLRLEPKAKEGKSNGDLVKSGLGPVVWYKKRRQPTAPSTEVRRLTGKGSFGADVGRGVNEKKKKKPACIEKTRPDVRRRGGNLDNITKNNGGQTNHGPQSSRKTEPGKRGEKKKATPISGHSKTNRGGKREKNQNAIAHLQV